MQPQFYRRLQSAVAHALKLPGKPYFVNSTRNKLYLITCEILRSIDLCVITHLHGTCPTENHARANFSLK